ncbi:MAG: hypothetical protein OES79_02410 [Planctomycetota bacterium]|nr:hypothetical protein [Planctomycetota bacterium]
MANPFLVARHRPVTDPLHLTQRAGKITWTVKLPPGEDKTLTYKQQRYVPSK